MLDREMRLPAAFEDFPPEEKKLWRDRESQRAKLWAGAVRICREYVDATSPAPDDLRTYPDAQTMLETEPGWTHLPHTKFFVLDDDVEDFQAGHWWCIRLDEVTACSLFDAGIRWTGPTDDQNGYWYRTQGRPFSRKGSPVQYRFFLLDELLRWFSRMRDRLQESEA
jgi:hypothetical protein